VDQAPAPQDPGRDKTSRNPARPPREPDGPPAAADSVPLPAASAPADGAPVRGCTPDWLD